MNINMFLESLSKKCFLWQISKLRRKSYKFLRSSSSAKKKANTVRTFTSLPKGWASNSYKNFSDYSQSYLHEDLEIINSYEDKADTFRKKYEKYQVKIKVLEEKVKNL